MTSRTRRWRGVRPVASAGPSGISRTVAVSRGAGGCLATGAPLGGVARTVPAGRHEFKHLVERVAFLAPTRGKRSYRRSIEGGVGRRRDSNQVDPAEAT